MTAVKLRNLVRNCFKNYKTHDVRKMEGTSNPYDSVQDLSFYVEVDDIPPETIDLVIDVFVKYRFSVYKTRDNNKWVSDDDLHVIRYHKYKKNSCRHSENEFYYEFTVLAPKKAKPPTLPYYD